MSNDYVIFTDNASDLSPRQLKEHDLEQINLGVHVPSNPNIQLADLSPEKFYGLTTPKNRAQTSAINPASFIATFQPIVKSGHDILYVGLSKTLSSSYNNSLMAARDLENKYPDRRIVCVDTLSAAPGLGILVKLAVAKRAAGCGIQEVADILTAKRFNVAHWFSVDEFDYLKAGGRMSHTAANVASTLKLCPLLHFDETGTLSKHDIARGEKNIMNKLAKIAKETRFDNNFTIAYGMHPEKALHLAEVVQKTIPDAQIEFARIGPIIGAHTGPSVISIFYMATHR